MDVKKQLTASIKAESGSDAEQNSTVDLISEASFSGVAMFIFSSRNFFGHEVTIGVRVDETPDNTLEVYFKASLCSEDDMFKKETGEEITLGRLVKADKDEPNIAIYVKNMSESEISDTITTSVTSFLNSYATLLTKRDMIHSLQEISKTMSKRGFKEQFKKYK